MLLGSQERINAETALRINLVTEVVPLERLLPRAHELDAICKNAPLACQGAVQGI